MPAHTIVVGLGNPILTDDGVGWHVVEQLRRSFYSPSVHVTEACVGGLSLAEMLVGYRRAIIVDAIITGNHPPGTISHLTLESFPGTLNTASAHDTNLPTALVALRRFQADLPGDDAIDVVAVEAHDVLTFGEQCTPAVERSISAAVEVLLSLLRSGA